MAFVSATYRTALRTPFCAAKRWTIAASSWIAGSDVNMVAIPDANPPQAKVSVTATTVQKPNTSEFSASYFALPGFKGSYYDADGTRSIVTFFAFDYGTWTQVQPVPMTRTTAAVTRQEKTREPIHSIRASPLARRRLARGIISKMNIYGPSSGHPSVINCLFGDGSVRAVRKDVDASALFFAVTRSNNDPAADDHL